MQHLLLFVCTFAVAFGQQDLGAIVQFVPGLRDIPYISNALSQQLLQGARGLQSLLGTRPREEVSYGGWQQQQEQEDNEQHSTFVLEQPQGYGAVQQRYGGTQPQYGFDMQEQNDHEEQESFWNFLNDDSGEDSSDEMEDHFLQEQTQQVYNFGQSEEDEDVEENSLQDF